MQNLSKLANALLLSALISAPAFAAEPAKGKAFATVNGIAISETPLTPSSLSKKPRAHRSRLS